MNRIVIISLILLAFVSCGKEVITEDETGKLRVKFTNESGEKIDDLKVGERVIGDLQNNETTFYFAYESFRFDGSLPDEIVTGTVNGNQLESYNKFYFCGTSKFQEKKGDFEMSIEIAEGEEVDFLKLSLK